jgi:transcriptional regulator with XRE-family HTH domain
MNRSPNKRTDDDRPAIWTGYGKLVKLFREEAGLTQQQLADAVGYSYEQVASIEQGRRPAKSAFTEAAERALSARGTLRALQEGVDLAKFPAFFQDFAVIELEAVSRFAFEPQVIPGLLQTEAYARAMLTGHYPPPDNETIEQWVEARLERQKLLTRTPVVDLSFVLGEPALHCPVGGPDVLRAQLLALLQIRTLRNVEVQIMPTSYGYHPGLNGPMVLLETAEHRHVGYIESQDVGVVISDAEKVSAFGLRYGRLRSEALNGEESARLIERAAGEL